MKRNEYDYKKMMDDFELETRRKKMFNGIRNKWQEISKGYMEKIEEMKIKNEKLYKERNKKFKQKIRKKELAIKSQIELKNQKLLEKKKEQEEYSKKKMDDVLIIRHRFLFLFSFLRCLFVKWRLNLYYFLYY